MQVDEAYMVVKHVNKIKNYEKNVEKRRKLKIEKREEEIDVRNMEIHEVKHLELMLLDVL